jgi:hypothetical protein
MPLSFPALRSCRLYTDCHWECKQVSSQFILEYRTDSSFDSIYQPNDASSDGLLSFIFSIRTWHLLRRLFHSRSPPRLLNAAAPGGLKPAPASPTPGGQLPSSIQHHKLTLVFVTHVRQAPRARPQNGSQSGSFWAKAGTCRSGSPP